MSIKRADSIHLSICMIGKNHRPIGLINSVALVRERTIPTEQPPIVGEISSNFCG
jgi:hypothetical protein